MAKDFNGNMIPKSENQNGMWIADVNWDSWGRSLTVYIQGVHALALINDVYFIIWKYGSSSLKVRAWDNAVKDSSAGQCDFSAWHFKRNGNNVTITCDNTSAIKVFA